MGIECVRKAYELLESGNWKVEKVTPKGDTISSTSREKLGKIYRLTVSTNFKYYWLKINISSLVKKNLSL